MEERCEIARLRSQGSSVRQIAAGVDRPPSTVARELKRNGSRTLGYQPSYANQQAHAVGGGAPGWSGTVRCGSRSWPVWARAGLRRRWPGVSRWTRGGRSSPMRASTGHLRPDGAEEGLLLAALPAPGPRPSAGFRGRRGGSPATHITHRVPLSQRPHAAADRATFGHWEGDLMHFGNHGPALLALAERHSRLVLLARPPRQGSRRHRRHHRPPAGPPPPGVAPDHHLRQRHRVRAALPPQCPRHPDLLLRYPIPLAEGGRGERHRPPAAPAPPQNPAG